FGATGGVMEAAIRTAYFMVTGKDLEDPVISSVRELDGVKETTVYINGLKLNFAVVSGIGNVRKVLENLNKYHFIEVMTCPGGCISGGGQPLGVNIDKVKSRMRTLYKIDEKAPIRYSHKNESVQKLYEEFLEKPLGEKSHHLLHTKYKKRSCNKQCVSR
ncbi:MAG: ferredoxin, partial [Candidatus Gastranaerophilales bacterium]|nr:ferredoxin [Candidatus Gastranaerophilales bacterium]